MTADELTTDYSSWKQIVTKVPNVVYKVIYNDWMVPGQSATPSHRNWDNNLQSITNYK